MKYVLIGLSNSHEISELVERNGNGDTAMESVEIGAGLYPLLSLANHACDPNVTRHCHNNRIVFRALQPIAAGEQVFVAGYKSYFFFFWAVHSFRIFFFSCLTITVTIMLPIRWKIVKNVCVISIISNVIVRPVKIIGLCTFSCRILVPNS